MIWDILKFPNCESGATSFTSLESGKAFGSDEASQVEHF